MRLLDFMLMIIINDKLSIPLYIFDKDRNWIFNSENGTGSKFNLPIGVSSISKWNNSVSN